MQIKNILFPVDFSDRCQSALAYVKGLARKSGAKVTYLYVMADPIASYIYMETALAGPVDVEAMRAQAVEQVKHFVQQGPDDPPAEYVARIGDAGHFIAEFAELTNASVIVLPTHGYGRFRRVLVGSVVAKVLHDAQCPVWTAAHVERTLAAHPDFSVTSMICGVDPAELAAQGSQLRNVQTAIEISRAMGATLRLAYVVPASTAGAERYMDKEFTRTMAKIAQEDLAKLQADLGTNYEVVIGSGRVSDELKALVEEYQADLLVIGRSKSHGPLGRLLSDALNIIAASPCPVLSV